MYKAEIFGPMCDFFSPSVISVVFNLPQRSQSTQREILKIFLCGKVGHDVIFTEKTKSLLKKSTNIKIKIEKKNK